MVNRKITLGLLALVGGLTVVGSGFCAWHFGDAVNGATQSINNAQITTIAKGLGTITASVVPEHVALELDQGGYANKTDLDKGISFVTGETTYNTAISAKYEISAKDSLNAMNAGLTATFDCTVTLKKEFADYIEFKKSFYSGNSTIGEDASHNATFKVSEPIDFDKAAITKNISFNIDTNADLVNSAFKYKDGKKPQTEEAFNTLWKLNTIAHENLLTFSYSLNVTTKK